MNLHRRLHGTVAAFVGPLLLSPLMPAAAQTVTWTGAAGDGLWSNPANWSTGVVPGQPDALGNYGSESVVNLTGQTIRTTGLANPIGLGNFQSNGELDAGSVGIVQGVFQVSNRLYTGSLGHGALSLVPPTITQGVGGEVFLTGGVSNQRVTLNASAQVSGTQGFAYLTGTGTLLLRQADSSQVLLNGPGPFTSLPGVLGSGLFDFRGSPEPLTATFSANRSGETLRVQSSPGAGAGNMINGPSGILEARNGGILNLRPLGATLENRGLIRAIDAGSRIEKVGDLMQTGAGRIELGTGTTLVLEDGILSGGTVTGTGNLETNDSVTNAFNATGTFHNARIGYLTGGTLRFTGTEHRVTGTFRNSAATWNGTLTVQAEPGGSALLGIPGGNAVLVDATYEYGSWGPHTLSGTGTIRGEMSGGFTSFATSGTISANVSGGTLSISGVANLTNSGTLEARNGGTLSLPSGGFPNLFSNTGTFRATGTGSLFSLGRNVNGDSVTGSRVGAVEVLSGGRLNIGVDSFSNPVTLNADRVTLAGTVSGEGELFANEFIVTGDSTFDTVLPRATMVTLQNNATLTVRGGSQLGIAVQGNGTVAFGDDPGGNRLLVPALPVGITVTGGSGTLRANDTATPFLNLGAIITTGHQLLLETGDFINAGSLRIQGTSSSLVIPSGRTLLNQGTITTNGTFAQLVATRLENSHTVRLTQGSAIVGTTDNASVIRLEGANTRYTTGAMTNSGDLLVQGVGSTVATATIENSGRVSIAAGTTVSTTGNYTQTAGLTQVNGTLRIDGTTLSLTGGRLCGTGTVAQGGASLTVEAFGGTMICPGMSPGILTIEGNLLMGPDAMLEIELGGRLPGQYDQLNITGFAYLAGTLLISRVNGFYPVVGDTFEFFKSSSSQGFWDNIVFGDRDITYQVETINTGNGASLRLTVLAIAAPEPATVGLLLLGTISGLGFWKMRPKSVLSGR